MMSGLPVQQGSNLRCRDSYAPMFEGPCRPVPLVRGVGLQEGGVYMPKTRIIAPPPALPWEIPFDRSTRIVNDLPHLLDDARVLIDSGLRRTIVIRPVGIR